MSISVSELRDTHAELSAFIASTELPSGSSSLAALKESANQIGRAWSQSWFGYHAHVYHQGLEPPPPGAHFSFESGLHDRFGETTGNWREYSPDEIKAEVTRTAGNPDLGPAREAATRGRELFSSAQGRILSILEIATSSRADGYLASLLEDCRKARLYTRRDFIEHLRPSGQFVSRDSLALSQGMWVPPHIAVLAEILELESPTQGCVKLADIAKKAAAHLERLEREQARNERVGTDVFIGHGRSLQWKELKDFVQDRLHLPWDEFNRVPVAGITNIARLSEMLDAAAVAFIIMTAEDEQADGKVRARMNVVHEAGLFQGRLGFTKAIVLLEDGCDEFSNIQGLGQIRFPPGKLSAAFEEIRQVLEREGVLVSE